MEFYNFFLFRGTIFACLNLDLDYQSGSAASIESGSNPALKYWYRNTVNFIAVFWIIFIGSIYLLLLSDFSILDLRSSVKKAPDPGSRVVTRNLKRI
jgi:hypothetical protein